MLQETNTSSITDTITFDGYTETVITGGTPTTTKFYSANGQRVAMRTSSTLSYLLADTLSSTSIALDSTGATQAVQLFVPYGIVRYSQGSMPTTYNFTGQRLDNQTGLLYYNFRYYDPLSGRFARADTQQNNANGMDPYAYVAGNPETTGDPTGHCGPLCLIGVAVAVVAIGAISGAVGGVVGEFTYGVVTGTTPTSQDYVDAAEKGAAVGAVGVVAIPLVGAGIFTGVGDPILAYFLATVVTGGLGGYALGGLHNFLHGRQVSSYERFRYFEELASKGKEDSTEEKPQSPTIGPIPPQHNDVNPPRYTTMVRSWLTEIWEHRWFLR